MNRNRVRVGDSAGDADGIALSSRERRFLIPSASSPVPPGFDGVMAPSITFIATCRTSVSAPFGIPSPLTALFQDSRHKQFKSSFLFFFDTERKTLLNEKTIPIKKIGIIWG